MFSRNLDHWLLQNRVRWFVLSGKAWRETQGATRAFALLIWIANVGGLASLVGIGLHAFGVRL